MRPFRNKSWPYLKKFESIIPVSGAKGRHVFAATHAAPPPSKTGEEEKIERERGLELSAKPGEGSGIKAGDETAMDVDEVVDISDDVPTSSSTKRKHKTLDDNSISPNSSPSFDNISSQSIEPPKKKSSSKATSKSASKPSASKPSSSRALVLSSSKAAARITPATAVVGMQGSINRLTDVFERAMTSPQDETSVKRNEAMQRLQVLDEGLTLEEKTKMIRLFMKDPVSADTYMVLNDDELRQNWVQSMLNEMADRDIGSGA
jgi:hypothetical protein